MSFRKYEVASKHSAGKSVVVHFVTYGYKDIHLASETALVIGKVYVAAV